MKNTNLPQYHHSCFDKKLNMIYCSPDYATTQQLFSEEDEKTRCRMIRRSDKPAAATAFLLLDKNFNMLVLLCVAEMHHRAASFQRFDVESYT